MKYKTYTIYVKHFPDCPDKSSKKIIEEARTKALEEAIKLFNKQIKPNIKAKEIKLAKEQIEEKGVMISIDEECLDKVLAELVEMEVVECIDAGYCGPPIKEEKKEKEVSSKDKMKKFLK